MLLAVEMPIKSMEGYAREQRVPPVRGIETDLSVLIGS